MNYLPCWSRRLRAAAEAPPPASPAPCLPIDVPAAAGRVHVVATAQQARSVVELLERLEVAAIAIDSEFGFARSPVPLRNGRSWCDIRSQRPVCFSFAALVRDRGGAHVLRGVFDIRRPGVAVGFGELLQLRVPLVFHHIKAELFSLWSLGLDPGLPIIADTYLTAACLHLGRHHQRAVCAQGPAGQILAGEEAERRHQHLLSLAGQCAHYGLAHPFAGAKEDLRNRFSELGDGQLEGRLVDYAVADAECTLRVHMAQQADVHMQGLTCHLHQVEFPFAVANARIEWNGVAVSVQRLGELRRGAAAAVDRHAEVLAMEGVDPPGSREQFLQRLDQLGLRGLCRRGGRESVAEDVLEVIEHRHRVIRSFRLHQKFGRLVSEEWLSGSLIGADGRLHPSHGQLGAATGRSSCRSPNLAGIGKVFRPVVVAPPGRALVELDYAQVEVGVAAAEHGDAALVAAYNSGDVYAVMAQRFYAARLSEADAGCSPAEFKRRHPARRDRMKTFVLAVLYNIQPQALAARFGVSVEEASDERERFLDLFPRLKERLPASADAGASRGYAAMVSGLRRMRPSAGRADTWTKNFLRNTPIQGSAAVVFKRAVVLLDQRFRGSRTLLVLPVHDSILIECDEAELDEVMTTARSLMELALRSFYPALDPKVDVNRADTSCWNKDGRSDSLGRFLDDPELRFDDLAADA